MSDRLAEEDPDARGPRSVTVDALPGYLLPNGSEVQMRGFVWLLLGVTGFTLLLACANLANLLLARASARQREIGVRLAIGAGRGRLVRQLLTESIVLALAGACAGVFLADLLIRLLGDFQLPGSVTIASLGIGLDGRLLAVALAIALLTTLFFGLVPAIQATRPEFVHALKGDSVRDGTSGSDRMRKGLIALQVATCCVLLVGSGLFLRTLRQGLDVNLGVDTEGVALARFSLGLLQYEPHDALAFGEDLLERVRGLPGVDAVSLSTRVPLQNGGAMGRFAEVEGYDRPEDEELRIDVVVVSPGYFESLRMPLVSGRGFERSDDESGAGVVVVNHAMANRYWPDGQAVGGMISVGEGFVYRVVGIAADATWNTLADDPTNYVYAPLAQSPELAVNAFLTLAAHTTSDAGALLPAMRAEIQGLEPELPIQTLSTMEDFLNRVLMPQRMGAALLNGLRPVGTAPLGARYRRRGGLHREPEVEGYRRADRTRCSRLRGAGPARHIDGASGGLGSVGRPDHGAYAHEDGRGLHVQGQPHRPPRLRLDRPRTGRRGGCCDAGAREEGHTHGPDPGVEDRVGRPRPGTGPSLFFLAGEPRDHFSVCLRSP